jgi:hypothetical protein
MIVAAISPLREDLSQVPSPCAGSLNSLVDQRIDGIAMSQILSLCAGMKQQQPVSLTLPAAVRYLGIP